MSVASLIVVLLAAEAAAPPAPPAPPAPAPPRQSTAIIDVSDRPPAPIVIERNGVVWNEWHNSSLPFECDSQKKALCITRSIRVRNTSMAVLRCRGAIRYAQPNDKGIPDAERYIIVPVKTGWNIVSSEAPLALTPVAYESDCTPEPELPPLVNPPECKTSFTKALSPSTYYPTKSRAAEQEGPVFVEITAVGEIPAAPTDIKVIQTSAYPELDAAAVQMFEELRVGTNCPGKRFRFMVAFKLLD